VNFSFSGIIVRYCENRNQAENENSAMARSHAVLDHYTQTSGEAKDQLHVNLWEVGESSVLDLGIMITDWRRLSAVQIDLPWEVDARDVIDLGTKLNSEKTVAAIFNEVVHYNGSADLNYAEISFRPSDYAGTNPSNEHNRGHFTLLRLNMNSYRLQLMNSADGTRSTQLRVSLPAELDSISAEKIYLRFRIKNVPPEVYSSVFRQKDRNILSSSTETRIIDFRINVRRGVPDEVLASDKTVWFPRFAKIHFFLTIERAQICDFESQNFVGCRSLFDEDVWNEYLRSESQDEKKKNVSVRNYLGYQWTASREKSLSTGPGPQTAVKDLVVLGRFSHNQSSWLYIARFLVLGLLFGMVGNALWDVFKPSKENYLASVVAQMSSLYMIAGICLFTWLLMLIPLERVALRKL
jgi:hypothetical protein